MSIDLSTLKLKALSIAQGYADAHILEVPENRGDQVEFFQKTTGGSPGDSWCADFVYACFLKAWCILKGYALDRATMLAHADEMSERTGIARTGYCPTQAAQAEKRGRLVKIYGAQPGDMVLYDFHAQGEPHHIEIVESVKNGLHTVGGNTSSGESGSQADGDGVFRRVRPLTHVYGFIHLEGAA